MADENKDAASATSGSSEETRQVNIDEIISKMQDAPTEVICDIKGLDANRYATKKTVAQGMLDIALLTSNASQLKYVLQVGPKHEFYMLLVVLISISIVLQVISAIVALVLCCIFNINRQNDQRRAEVLNDVSLAFKVVSITVNIIIGVFFSIQIDNFPALTQA
ncbi:ninjurin-2-like isoform X4 [Hyposmocoma kahamanoa]|uniref:ninjurin-2-like isoform X4 n=1 Tax=Hyposmocoma kahamanoa TaxID=1477025 RepID=UPI000E6D784C|nr:ninjurin-2-like isoform X4 [Hyposmocoma kahamanoa]